MEEFNEKNSNHATRDIILFLHLLKSPNEDKFALSVTISMGFLSNPKSVIRTNFV